MELASAANTLTAAGVKVTAEQFKQMAVLADNLTDKGVFGSVGEALDSLSNGFIRLSERSLKPFGLSVKEGATDTEKLADLFDQLGVKASELDPILAGVTDNVDDLTTNVSDLVGVLWSASGEATKGGTLSGAFESVNSGLATFNSLMLNAPFETMNFFKDLYFDVLLFGEGVDTAASKLRGFYATTGAKKAPTQTTTQFEPTLSPIDVSLITAPKTGGGGGGGRRRAPAEVGEQTFWNPLEGMGAYDISGLLDVQAQATANTESWAQAQTELNDLLGYTVELQVEQTDATANQIVMQNEWAIALEENFNKLTFASSVTAGAFNLMDDAIAASVRAAVTGSKSINQALKEAFAEGLLAIAIEMYVKAAKEFAEAAAMAAGIYTAGLAAPHIAAGAKYLLVGGLATAGAVALGASGKGPVGGGGGGGGGAGYGGGGSNYTAPRQQTNETTVEVVVNVDGDLVYKAMSRENRRRIGAGQGTI
jgi:hypothetical protein